MVLKLAEPWHMLLFVHLIPHLYLLFMHITAVWKRYSKRCLSSGLVTITSMSLASSVCLDSLDRFLAFALTDQLVVEVQCYFLCQSVASHRSVIYTFISNLLTVFDFSNRWIEAFQEGTIL